jgi:hypothetical protein
MLDYSSPEDSHNIMPVSDVATADRRLRRTTEASNELGSTIHLADSVDGPWIPLQNHTLGDCNNPAPFVVFASCEKAHIIYIVCSRAGHSELKRAEDIRGPWETVSVITPMNTQAEHKDDLKEVHYEDPALYIDNRGFHVIYHAYIRNEHPPHGHDCTKSTVAKYLFSKDGKQWHIAPGCPYGTQIEVKGQGNITIATRERPSLLFGKDASGQARMTHLLTSACSAPNCPGGNPRGCVNCKYVHWDYTLIQPLAA